MEELNAGAAQDGRQDPRVAGHVGHFGVAWQIEVGVQTDLRRVLESANQVFQLQKFGLNGEGQGVCHKPAVPEGFLDPLFPKG